MSQSFPSLLAPQRVAYLALKKALGRRYCVETDVLKRLDRFLFEQQLPELTKAAFTAWSCSFDSLKPTVRRSRMRIVRNFCLYLRRSAPDCFVPDPSGFPAPHEPRRPHIFSEQQIVKLLRVATSLPSRSTSLLRAAVFRIAVVLLYTTGLRRGELVRLVMSDYDPTERTLLVRTSNFHKSRRVAFSMSAVQEMERYLQARRRLPHTPSSALLVSNYRGLRPYSGTSFGLSMRALFRRAGVYAQDGGLPHVHDLRHTFAVHALLRWYRAGLDVQTKLPALSIAMGHVSIASTAYYLGLLEPVLAEASARFETHCHRIVASQAGAP